jgi:hypothetical protein
MSRWISTLILLAFLSACSGMGSDGGQSITPTPTATVDPSGYQMVDPRACLVSEWKTLQTEQLRNQNVTWRQGDLLAWRPGQPAGQGQVAYLAPSPRSSWFNGVLTLARGSQFEDQFSLAPNVLANGDLTWSPDGEHLAFIAFRSSENAYTVMSVSADGTGLVDLFPTDLALTDSRSSQKAIIGWRDNSTVQVMSSCGEECRTAYDIDVTAPPKPVLTPIPVNNYRELLANLQTSENIRVVTPAAFPKNMRVTPAALSLNVSTANWAPDGNLVVYTDRRGILWLLSISEKINYILDIGLRDVYEMQWSTASDYLAIRAEDQLFVFQVPCGQ